MKNLLKRINRNLAEKKPSDGNGRHREKTIRMMEELHLVNNGRMTVSTYILLAVREGYRR